MAIFKCKMCGGDIEIIEGTTVAECLYCGTKQTVPNVNDEKRINLFNRANRLRMNSEFDKAGAIYEQIIAEFPEEAEAYWGLCLCNYGIEYVDDPATAAKIPTVHRASFEKMRKDENYELALEYADTDARIVYQEQAKEIDRIMGEILAISSSETPYDIFICYKETNNSGSRTPDSVIAQDIYDELTKKGYKVFFSRITLEDKLGRQYEPYIFAALNSAKLMLAIGTDYEYYNAVWVKNEWSRFLKLMAKDKSKMLIPCFKDMDAYDMPEQFKGLQAQDMGKLGFMQDLLRGIDKIFGREKKAEVERVVIKEQSNNPTVESLLKRVFIFLKDGEWQSADEYCERVLDIEPENARAYLGKLMADLEVRTEENLKNVSKPFDDDKDYIKVCALDSKLAEKLKADNDFIRERNETARKQSIYDKASRAAAEAKTDAQFNAAAAEFEKIPGFKDADMRAADCRKKAKAFELKVESVAAVLKNSDTKSEQQALETQFAGLSELIERKNGKTAEYSFAEAKRLCESDEQLRTAIVKKYPELSIILAKAGSFVTFGSYPQTADGTKKPIEWLVLERTEKQALLISRYALDCKKYNDTNSYVTWESCSLRRWLNGEFLNTAFTPAQQSLIALSNVSAVRNPEYSTNPGKATKDKIFLLSIPEAEKYFKTDKARLCAPTAYSKAHGALTSIEYKTTDGEAACWWWLRSPGYSQTYAALVYKYGSVYYGGNGVRNDHDCVRPALRINLDS